ncbi:MAG: LysR family transcriptional regulator [Lachnospiraceae bacterium]|nr:LysR family transcriptional regulator [Lachnospiraceae bacterium]
MDLRQLEYIVAIDEEKSIAKAAKKLYMTQSALNQQLLKTERDLGVLLFERRYHELIPTLAGRLYISSARQILNIREDTYRIIRDIASEEVGEISFAYSPERGSLTFSSVYPIFHKEYPNFKFKVEEVRVPKAIELLLHHEVNYAMITYSDHHPLPSELDYIDIGKESMVLSVPKSHPLAELAGEKSWERLPEIDLQLFRDDSFILCSNKTSLRKMIDYCLSVHQLTPDVLLESANSYTILRMVSKGMGVGFLPESYASEEQSVVFFRPQPVQYWNRCIAFRKGTYITAPERRLFDLIIDFHSGKIPQ